MSGKPIQVDSKAKKATHLFASGSSKNQSGSITSDHIAEQIAAFKKHGGRIEVLGNTPLRANVTAFSSKGNTQRKAGTVGAEKATG